MKNLFGDIYCWFEPLFGQNLAEHLWGYNCETLAYERNAFNTIGLITLAISFLIVMIYYYGINHPRFNRWWSWLIILGITGTINLFIGYYWTATDFHYGYIGDCLMYVRDADGVIISHLIHESDCWKFGVANFIVSIGFFTILSFIFKWWSTNCKRSPFL